MEPISFILGALSILNAANKLYLTLMETYRRRRELSPEQEAEVQAKYEAIWQGRHHQIDPDPTGIENGK
jgi:hypothetical protein